MIDGWNNSGSDEKKREKTRFHMRKCKFYK